MWTTLVHKEIFFYLWTKIDHKMKRQSFTSFGEHIRTLRETAGLSLRQATCDLQIDPSLLAKYERNERQPSKQIVKQIADYYGIDSKKLLTQFLSDQIAYKILDEEEGLEILKVAEEKVVYLKSKRQ
jgi:transcriptional regulator with XRE-family HTH domain